MTTFCCQNCGSEFESLAVEFPDIPNLTDRIMPGEVVPDGECPNCGALVHEKSADKLGMTAREFGTILAALRLWQRLQERRDNNEIMLATCDHAETPLSQAEIDRLIEKLLYESH